MGTEQTESLGQKSIHLKDAQNPTLLFPFAAPSVTGDLGDADAIREEINVLLWSERMIRGWRRSRQVRRRGRLHVVLPGSPNRGLFGGNGAYGEAKAALDAVGPRWKAETSWAHRVRCPCDRRMDAARRLMGHNDAIVDAVHEAGVTTYSTDEMARSCSTCVTPSPRRRGAGTAPGDLTGRAACSTSTYPSGCHPRRDRAPKPRRADAVDTLHRRHPRRLAGAGRTGTTSTSSRPPVVIVGGGEVGPYGSSRTRFD